jgi:excisionase family DNA binding protein
MATNTDKLIERARDAQRRLESQGLRDEARVMRDLVTEVQALQPQAARGFYTTAEAGRLIGVTGQTVKNWVARGLLTGYRLGGRVVIPRAALEAYSSLGAAMEAIEPLPPVEQIVSELRAQRRPSAWPRRGESPRQPEPDE